MKYFNIVIILCVTIIINSCTHAFNEGYLELPSNYFFKRDGRITSIENHHSLLKRDIYSNIVDFKYNDNFIIVEQNPDTINYKNIILSDTLYKKTELTKNELTEINVYVDSIFNNSENIKKIFKNEINYWIISVKLDTLMGPLDENEYQLQRNLLNVPKELELINSPLK